MTFQKAVKYDAGKPMWRLLQWRALRRVAEVATAGAKKYSPDNWKSFPPDEARIRYTDAMLRHTAAWLIGERYDPESGQPHLAHIAWNALSLLEFEEGITPPPSSPPPTPPVAPSS